MVVKEIRMVSNKLSKVIMKPWCLVISVGYLEVEVQVANCITKICWGDAIKVISNIVAHTCKLEVLYLRIGKSTHGIVCYVIVGWQKLVIYFLVQRFLAIQGCHCRNWSKFQNMGSILIQHVGVDDTVVWSWLGDCFRSSCFVLSPLSLFLNWFTTFLTLGYYSCWNVKT